MRKRLGLSVALAFAAIVQSGASATATKSDGIAFGEGVLCNTQQQMQRYLTIYRGETSPEDAVQAVNTETASPGACGFAFIAFVPVNIVGSVPVNGGVMRMVQITVLARKTERGWVNVKPTQQFTAVFDKADEA